MNLRLFLGFWALRIVVASTMRLSSSSSACNLVDPYFLRDTDYDAIHDYVNMIHVSARGALGRFSKQLFPYIVNDQTSNFVVSMLGPFLSLYGIAFGAHGITEDVMKVDLQLQTRNINYKIGLPILRQDLLNYREIDLHASTALFYPRGLDICPDFIQVLEKVLGTSVQKIDFAEPNGAIGQWCAEQTRGRFKNPPNSGNVTENIGLEFANVAYLKGPWSQKFDLLDTKKRPFYVNGGEEKLIPIMGVEGVFRHGEIADPPATFVNIPFAFESNNTHIASMFIVLPKGTDNIADHEVQFQKSNFAAHINSGEVGKIYVQLPKFSVSSKIDFVEPMKKVAKSRQNHLFVPSETNFKGITEHPELSLDDFLQFSTIKINEEGIEAVAASGCGQPTEFVDEAPPDDGPAPQRDGSLKSFIVNRPFYVRIVAKTDWSTMLFSFRMSG